MIKKIHNSITNFVYAPNLQPCLSSYVNFFKDELDHYEIS
jgi:hypothetical protein